MRLALMLALVFMAGCESEYMKECVSDCRQKLEGCHDKGLKEKPAVFCEKTCELGDKGDFTARNVAKSSIAIAVNLCAWKAGHADTDE